MITRHSSIVYVLSIFFIFYSSSLLVYSATKHVIQWNVNVKNLTTTIIAGDTVAWNWTDSVEMSVQSAANKYSFQSSPIISQQGYQYEITFTRPGKYPYRCGVHPLVGGVIKVTSTTAAPTASPTTSSSAVKVVYPSMVYPVMISSPASVAKNWNMNLFVREARVNIGALSFTSRLFCTRTSQSSCTYPGPTIRVRPGDNVTIFFTNQLGSDVTIPTSFPRLPSHGVNTTNLYFHGLRVSPNRTYFRQVAPGETATIVVSVQPNHAPGVHWYRSQNQGFSTLHVLNGLIGAVIVEPESTVSRLNYPASLKSADMVLLVVTKVVIGQETVGGAVSQGCGPRRRCNPSSQPPLCTGSEDFSPFNSYRLYSIKELSEQSGGLFDTNIQYNSSYQGPAYSNSMDLVNGRYQPVITITQSSPIIFRMVHASGGPPLRLSLTDGAACIMTVIAWDGVYTRSRVNLDVVTIPAGGRCEIEVKCVDLGQVQLFNQENNNQVLMNIKVQALPQGGILRKNVKDEHLQEITRPTYLTETLEIEANQYFSVNFDQSGRNSTNCEYWLGSGESCSASTADSDALQCQYEPYKGPLGLNKWSYVADNKFITFDGALVEVTLFGSGIDLLPFHIQSGVFQIVSYSSSVDLSNYFQIGSWRDTLPPIADNITIRFKALGRNSETVYGTSFLPQQDKGILSSFLVLDISEFQSLTVPPTSAPTVTPDDDLIGPLGMMWIIMIATGVVLICVLASAYLAFFTKDRVYIVPKTEF